MYHKFRLFFFLFLLHSSSWSQIPVWQGFELNWTYNHRISRIGSFMYNDSVYATAATGIGRDSGWFNTHYIQLPAENKQYHEFKIYQRIEAKENRLIVADGHEWRFSLSSEATAEGKFGRVAGNTGIRCRQPAVGSGQPPSFSARSSHRAAIGSQSVNTRV